MKTRFFCILFLLAGCLALDAQNLDYAISESERLLASRQYSKAKGFIRVQIHECLSEELIASPPPDQLAKLERLSNNLRESQIMTGDYLSVLEDFTKGDMQFQTYREYFRFFHLNSLWLRSAPVRAEFGTSQCHAMNLKCTRSALEMLQKYGEFLADKRRIQRIVWDDLLIAYGDMGDYDGFSPILNQMKGTVESIAYSSKDWPHVYWYYRALLWRKDGDFETSQQMLKKVLLHALKLDPDFAVNPWYVYATTEAALGNMEEARAVTAMTFKSFQSEDGTQLRTMIKEDRYSVDRSVSLVRNYYLLPDLPTGCFEDVLYDAVLFSKNILLDTDRTISSYVNHCNDEELINAFERMNYLSADETSWYPSFLFQELYEKSNPASSGKAYSWRNVEKQLGAKDVAIEFVRTGKGYTDYYALILRKGWPRPVMVSLGNDKAFRLIQADARSHRENARVNASLVLRPLLPYINRNDNIYYSADGLIAQLNLDALRLDSGELAGDVYRFHRVTSTSDIQVPKAQEFDTALLYGGMDYGASAESVAGETSLFHVVQSVYMTEWGRIDDIFCDNDYGWVEINGKEERSGYDNLRYTEQEIRRIRQSWRKSGGCYEYSGIRAIEESLKSWGIRRELPPNSIIHLATHSISRKLDMRKYWMLSRLDEDFRCEGLLFTGARSSIEGLPYPKDIMNDGILWGNEIASLNLENADLVVLSACHTARGKDTLDGVLGLQRAFKEAGAHTILMTLWRVNDKATMTFMEAFYNALFSGQSKYDAYKAAQKHVRENYSDDPYFWAPYVLLD